MSAPPPRAASGSQASTSQACEALKQRFPCREAIIDQLRDMIVHGSTAGPVLAVGPPATGKTAVVRWGGRAGGGALLGWCPILAVLCSLLTL